MIISDYIMRVGRETFFIFVEAAPYILFGLVAAGLLSAFFPQDKIHRLLGRRSLGSVIKASLFGIPLPLCSCGVIPAALTLRRRGASRGATASFLISTPETGVESIALTYGLLGPLMAVVRPVAALITSITAGVLVNAIDRQETAMAATPQPTCSSCTADQPATAQTLGERLSSSVRYVFVDLLGDIGGWLLLGLFISGVISALLPHGFFAAKLGPDWVTMLLMLVIGLPMYICASASTPVAAALMLKGVSPGAALVLLMVGPATNVTTLIIVSRELGKKSAVAYLAAIIVCSLGIALTVDALIGHFSLEFPVSFSPEQHLLPYWLGLTSAIILLAFILNHYRKKFFVRQTSCPCSKDVSPITTQEQTTT